MVKIDTTFCTTKEMTPDPVELELLEIAENCSADEYNQMIEKKGSWPALYHFSHIRENILDFIEFQKEDTVLEIGAACGALTGILSERNRQVDCIERNPVYCQINALRGKDRDNVAIFAGDYEKIEKTLPDTYNWVTMIGVLAYAPAYIDSEDPYVDFLKSASSHLALGGKLLLAIPNRLGMQYLSGVCEEGTKQYFSGIEGYPKELMTRTFTKPELESLITQAGLTVSSFAYPYPDYRFPMSIYTDDYLPTPGELNRNKNNYDQKRLVVFDESNAFDSLVDTGMFPLFSNSFFVMIERKNNS